MLNKTLILENHIYEPQYNYDYNEIYYHNIMALLLIALILVHLVF